MSPRDARILILCKTYPSPSGKYSETSCVAGMGEDGSLIRLFPVPFRLIAGDQQFRKWQWITAKIYKANGDNRPESHKIYVDTINCDPQPLSTKRNWAQRRDWLDKIALYNDFDVLEADRIASGTTLGLLRPSKLLGLEITPMDSPDWSDEEQKKLVKHEQQAGLFDDESKRALTTLRKVPYAFHYRYECQINGVARTYRHKIVDWEAGALYWNCCRLHGAGWERPFRAKLEEQLAKAELMFLLGTIHRFPDQWLIVSLIYPPKRAEAATAQGALAL